MDFAEQLTLYADALRRPASYGPLMHMLPKGNKDGARLMFYLELLAKVTKKGASDANGTRESVASSIMELLWYGCRERYYKVWPAYIEMFKKTRLDLPASVFQVPAQTFSIRFPKGQTQLMLGTRPAMSLMLTVARKNVVTHALNTYAADPIGASPAKLVEKVQAMNAASTSQPRIASMSVWVGGHNGELEPEKSAKLYYRMTIKEDAMLQDLLTVRDEHVHPEAMQLTDDDVMQKFLQDCFRVALSVSFLATGQDRLIDPDVLNADLQKYLDAVNAGDDEKIARLAEKAHNRRSADGYLVGREDLLGRRYHPRAKRLDAEMSERELRFQHMRQPHFHLFWTGAERTVPLVRFLRPIIVREDLPPNPTEMPRGTTTPADA